MVEKKRSGYWLTHLGLILGVLFIFFPVWLTFVASTVTQDAIIYPPLPMLPGTEFFENYSNALFRGSPEGFVSQDLGSSAAQSVILLVLVGILTVIQFKYIERKVHY